MNMKKNAIIINVNYEIDEKNIKNNANVIAKIMATIVDYFVTFSYIVLNILILHFVLCLRS